MLTATELSTLSTHGHQATQVIAGSFSFSSQGPLRARWLFLLVQEGLGYPASRQTETLGGWRGPGSAVGSLKQDSDSTPSCPAEWWGSGETAPPKLLLDMQESAFSSVSLHGKESQQVLCLPALSFLHPSIWQLPWLYLEKDTNTLKPVQSSWPSLTHPCTTLEDDGAAGPAAGDLPVPQLS